MCDTIVALANSTADGSVIFGKNSDRDPNEAHEVLIIPAAQHPAGSTVKCTYIEIPQVEETYRVLLAKPFWIWGAEMGSNEYGVTIGNEAVFTKTTYDREPGLIGMDFLHLALERTRSAEDALYLIIHLLEEYGQSGNCGFAHPMYYHNSLLVCDTREAWVLETSGREWAAEKVIDIRSISNAITIGDHWDLASTNLVNTAVKNGWCRNASEFNFARCYSDTIYTNFGAGKTRQACTTSKLREIKGNITPRNMMQMLRSHRFDGDPDGSPDRGITGADVCMHAGWGPVRGSQTTGSMVSILREDKPCLHWVTATSAPCTSLFKPVWLDSGLPENGVNPRGEYDQATLFWRHEALHREVLRDYASRIRSIRPKQAEFEERYLQLAETSAAASVENRAGITREAFRQADELEGDLLLEVTDMPVVKKIRPLYQIVWKKLEREAKML